MATGPWLKCMEEWANMDVPIIGIKSTSCVWEPKTSLPLEAPAAPFCSEHPKFGTHIEVHHAYASTYLIKNNVKFIK